MLVRLSRHSGLHLKKSHSPVVSQQAIVKTAGNLPVLFKDFEISYFISVNVEPYHCDFAV